MSPLIYVILAAVGVAGIGFVIGLSKKRIIDKESAAKFAFAYDGSLVMGDFVASEDRYSAIAISNKGILLFKSIGDNICTRLINPSEIIRNGGVLRFRLNDIGFPDFSADFNATDLDDFYAKGVENA